MDRAHPLHPRSLIKIQWLQRFTIQPKLSWVFPDFYVNPSPKVLCNNSSPALTVSKRTGTICIIIATMEGLCRPTYSRIPVANISDKINHPVQCFALYFWDSWYNSQALRIALLQESPKGLDVKSNQWQANPWPIKHQRIAYLQSRGPGCFDHRYYLDKNVDLQVLKTLLEVWDHFVHLGQFEGRSHRYVQLLPWSGAVLSTLHVIQWSHVDCTLACTLCSSS